jgi:hypothetical protein
MPFLQVCGFNHGLLVSFSASFTTSQKFEHPAFVLGNRSAMEIDDLFVFIGVNS